LGAARLIIIAAGPIITLGRIIGLEPASPKQAPALRLGIGADYGLPGLTTVTGSVPVATDLVRNIPGHDDVQARVIAATVDGVRIIGVYIPNGQSVESEKFPYKLAWLSALRRWVEQECAAHPHLALLGDYNIAPEDCDVHDPVTWSGQVLCTPEERAHFKGLLALGLHDSFRLFEQPPKSWSWWDYRNLAFRKNQGLRIDHILVSEALKPRVQSCVIDKLTRKNERPSDHAPVIVELQLA